MSGEPERLGFESGGTPPGGPPVDPPARDPRACDDGYRDLPYQPTFRKQFPQLSASRVRVALIMTHIWDMTVGRDEDEPITPTEAAWTFTQLHPTTPVEAGDINNIFNYFTHEDVDDLIEGKLVAATGDKGRLPIWAQRRLDDGSEVAFATPLRRPTLNGGAAALPDTMNPAENWAFKAINESLRDLGNRGSNRDYIKAVAGQTTVHDTAELAKGRNKQVIKSDERAKLAETKLEEMLRLSRDQRAGRTPKE